jgi:hypothetical protein
MNQKYFVSLFVISVLTAAGIYVWNYYMPKFSNNHAWFILAYYVIVTTAIHYWLINHVDPKKFVMRFMGITGMKLFLNLIVILVYGLSLRHKAISFALMFMMIYFIFTFFESYQLIQSLKHKKENL